MFICKIVNKIDEDELKPFNEKFKNGNVIELDSIKELRTLLDETDGVELKEDLNEYGDEQYVDVDLLVNDDHFTLWINKGVDYNHYY